MANLIIETMVAIERAKIRTGAADLSTDYDCDGQIAHQRTDDATTHNNVELRCDRPSVKIRSTDENARQQTDTKPTKQTTPLVSLKRVTFTSHKRTLTA
ncbi:hypothetical protein [Pseudogulbenkiania sp. NH8B]|uniref:hypothetical protein n=1 Tax=Pseudogulbenkiania sp. (strain NH8B) TaxID=748280 RepID=UPI0011D2A5C7|nr:hypothetical protein [Pseudogulbenkiania sp. NH8B]